MAMRKGAKKVSKSERVKKNEDEMRKLAEENRHVPKPPESPVVTTATPTLWAAANDAIGRFETQCLVKGDE